MVKKKKGVKEKKGHFFKRIINQTVSLYLIAATVLVFGVNYEKLNIGTNIRMQRYSSEKSYRDLVGVMNQTNAVNQSVFKGYAYYYEKILENAPENGAALTVLGYCYYHLEKKDKAIAAYKQAIKTNPDVFWNYFNLGVIYFKKGAYRDAVSYLDLAIEKMPEASLSFINDSKAIFKPIIESNQLTVEQLREQLKGGYKDAYQMLVISHYRLKQYQLMMKYAQYAQIAKIGSLDVFYFYMGLSAYKQRNVDLALDYVQKSLDINPTLKIAEGLDDLCEKAKSSGGAYDLEQALSPFAELKLEKTAVRVF